MSNSYKDIMKATSVIGAVQVIRLFFGLIRNKLIALFFGPAGIGVWGLYLSFIEMMQSAASLGLEKSAVKQIAESPSDTQKRNLAIQVSQYAVAVFSFICSVFVATFASEISISLFDSTDYKVGVWACSAVIFINSVTAIIKAVLNGLSEIKALAISQLMGVLLGNVFVFACLPFFPISAIPFYFLVISVAAFIPVFLSYRSLGIAWVGSTLLESMTTLAQLMKLGLAFWVSAFFMALITYMINLHLKDEFSLEVVGIYQASWAISNLYIGVILSSMGVVFFPKVCRTINDDHETRKVINDQVEFGLLVSLPFLLMFFIFAPVFLKVLYSSDFEVGESIIRWLILGVIIRLFGFPFGYALMAKGHSLLYVVAQVIFNASNYLLILTATNLYGFKILGANYFIAYCLYAVLMAVFCYRALSYKVSVSVIKIVLVYILFILISLILLFLSSVVTFYLCGLLIVFIAFIYSYKQLVYKMEIDVVQFVKNKLVR